MEPSRTVPLNRIKLLAAVAAALVIVLAFARGAPDTANALPPFTPTFTLTIDDAAPDDPSVVPASDTCEVGVPCKAHYHLTIPDGQPGPVSSNTGIGPQVILPDSYVSVFGDASVPDGAIVGRNWGQSRSGAVGSCGSGVVFPFDQAVYDATTVHATTTGNASDLLSFDHWPVQLDGVVSSVATSHPGSTLTLRWVIPTSPFNVLMFHLVGGETLFLAVGSDPSAPPVSQSCGPYDLNFMILGLSRDNPATAADESGVPLNTCAAPGTSSWELTIDRNDTPPGDTTTLFDTTSCTENTPPGAAVDVPLLGGTSTLGGIDVSFDSVTSQGSTSATGASSGPPPPTGFQVIGVGAAPTYYDINTTAAFTGPVTLCIHYDDSGVPPAEEANLRLMQYDGSAFIDRTTSVDTVANIICASAPSFSTWAIMAVPSAVGGDVKILRGPADGGSLTLYILLGAVATIVAIGAAGALAARHRRHAV